MTRDGSSYLYPFLFALLFFRRSLDRGNTLLVHPPPRILQFSLSNLLPQNNCSHSMLVLCKGKTCSSLSEVQKSLQSPVHFYPRRYVVTSRNCQSCPVATFFEILHFYMINHQLLELVHKICLGIFLMFWIYFFLAITGGGRDRFYPCFYFSVFLRFDFALTTAARKPGNVSTA